MKHPHSPWNLLVTAARQLRPEPADESAPAGFATRVSALAFARMELPFADLFSRFATRALAACCLFMVIGVSLNLGPVLKAIEPTPTPLTDPVTEWLEASS
jgi:hypothetical protein